MLADSESRWWLRWWCLCREPLSRLWPREGEAARGGECDDIRRLLRRPRSSASASASVSGSTIVGMSGCLVCSVSKVLVFARSRE